MKKILASILLFAMTFCMFGCGGNEQGEKKLQTVDEIIAELDNQIGDYDEKGFVKEYDPFNKTTIISEKQEIYTYGMEDNLEENGEFYAFMPIIGIEHEGGNPKFLCSIGGIYSSIEKKMPNVTGMMISDGNNLLDLLCSETYNDFGTAGVVCIVNIKDKDCLEKAKNIANSENNLTVRFNQDNNGLIINDHILTDKEDIRVKYMLKLYLDVAEKIDTSKIHIGETK